MYSFIRFFFLPKESKNSLRRSIYITMSSEDNVEEHEQSTAPLPSLNVRDSDGNQVALEPAREQRGMPLHPQSLNSHRRVRKPNPSKDRSHEHFIPVTKPRITLRGKILYAIGIVIILVGISVLLYFLITGSKDLDSSLENIQKVTSEDLTKLKAAHELATEDLVQAEDDRWKAKEAHELAMKDLGQLDTAYKISNEAQAKLYKTLDQISKAAHAIGDALALPL